MADTYTRRINLYINGKEVKNDIASIKAEMNKLVAQQARMTIGSQEYVKAGKEIKTLKAAIQQHNNDLKTTTGLWDKLGKAGDNFNRYFTMFATFAAGFGGLIYSGKQAISAFAEFDDKVGDVMKTTGLAKDRVYAMNEELKKMDTRTAQEELLGLGRIAGKLGINAEEDVKGFIRAADKINVALKEDLGGNAEEAINEVGKLVDIFKVKDKFGIEDSMLKVGSAINALGAASTASESYLVEFTKRVAGIAPAAGVSIQQTLGLAATLDQLGQTSEVSSTVYSAVMTGMFKDTADYAKIAGMSLKDFSGLLKKDANEAFIKLLEGLRGNTGGMTELTAKMDGLGLEGKRSIAVLGVLANNTDILRESQKLSNVEFDKGTSLTNEFNVKNETAQAKLDKASKSLGNMTVELGQKLMPVLTMSTSGMGYFVKAMSVITDFAIKYSGAIITVSSAIAAYTVIAKIEAYWMDKTFKARLANMSAAKAYKIATEAQTKATAYNVAATTAQEAADIAAAEAKQLQVIATTAKKAAESAAVKTIALETAATEAQILADNASVKSKELNIIATNAKKIANNASTKATGLNTAATEAQILADKTATKTTIYGTIATKASEIGKKTGAAATLLYAAAKALLTFNIGRASAAMRVFNTTVGVSPIGILVGLLALATGAYLLLRNGISETARAASDLYSTLVIQRGEMNNLFETVKKTGEGTKERAEGIKKINEVYGQYLPNLLDEKASLTEIKRAQLDANEALRESIALKSKEKAKTEIIEKSAEKQKKIIESMIETITKNKGAATAGLFASGLDDMIKSSDKFKASWEDPKFFKDVKSFSERFGFDTRDFTFMLNDIMIARQNETKELNKQDLFFDNFMIRKEKALTIEEQIAQKRTELRKAETTNEKQMIQYEIDILTGKINFKKIEAERLKKEAAEEAKKNALGFGSPSNNKYSLNNDLEYLRQKSILNKQFAKGEIKTQQELDDKLLAIEIDTLDKRIKSGKEKGKELADLRVEMSEKLVKQKQEELKREKDLTDTAKDGMSDMEKEKSSYDERLLQLGLYGKSILDMTEMELKAYMSLQKMHYLKLDELDAKAIKEEIERKQNAYNAELNSMKAAHAEELNNITTLEQAKEILKSTMSEKELSKIKNLKEAKKKIEKQQGEEEKKLQRERLESLLKELKSTLKNGTFNGLNLSDKILSEEEKKVIINDISDVEKDLSKLLDLTEDKRKLNGIDKVDLLGFTEEDWNLFFDNLKFSKVSAEEVINTLYMGFEALGNIWQNYNSFVSAGEKQQLQEFEANQDKKKKELKKQLENGLINQETYNTQVEKLDNETNLKKAQLDRDQAKRDRNVALMSAIVNTAAAVTKALPNLFLAALVGAAGAFQIGTILATPLPQLPGAEEGGYLDVNRSQDGKRFRAKNNPNKRGFVNSPTVITGENGSEYIVPADAVNNPTIRPILDMLEMARQRDGLASLNFNKAYGASLSGRASGGSIDSARFDSAQRTGDSYSNRSSDLELKQIILNNTRIMENLQKKLDDPIKTYVTVHGKNGLAEKMQEYTNLKNNASL